MKKGNFVLFISFVFYSSLSAVIGQWDWSHISYDDLLCPEIVGVGLSAYQNVNKNDTSSSNWKSWEKKRTHKGHSTIHNNEKSGMDVDFLHGYQTYVSLIENVGANSFRFSVEWASLEPEKGKWNEEAFEYYVLLVDELIAHNIAPMITLHHFTHPQWFEDQGGFACEKNIKYFVRFCKKIFSKLSDKVKLWCTINEIGPFVFQGYINGVFPPGINNIFTAARVMRVMMKAHCRVYRELKSMPNGQESEIGLVHQYLPFEPYCTNNLSTMIGSCLQGAGIYGLVSWLTGGKSTRNAAFGGLIGTAAFLKGLNLTEQIPAAFLSYVFNDALIKCLKTGKLFSWIPGFSTNIPDAPHSFDFIGINVYSRVVLQSDIMQQVTSGRLDMAVRPACRENELMTDMQYGICPEALYQAIVTFSALGKPMYITENGAADRRDDIRALYIKRNLYALSEALRDGYDVRGYYYWTLVDNFEWNDGWSQKFGLYRVTGDDNIPFVLKNGSQPYLDYIKDARVKRNPKK